ncbi:MAG: excinuclease ABC subunit UvrC [Bacilli bacterium]
MNSIIRNQIKEKLTLVPPKPGSYQMKNKDGLIIYVGKAKNLKNRLKSYFTGSVTGKTAMLVNDIVTFEYIVTTSELESLILEITLIKKYNPKYNILLKDDKSYPYIELTNETYPILKVVRNINRKKDKNKLFGPFPNVTSARKTVEIINRIYPLRKCNKLKKEVCLYYHLGECLGYCSKKVETSKLTPMLNEIVTFLKGDSSIVTTKLNKAMAEASLNMNYEKALELKGMLNDIEVTLRHQKIDLNKDYNLDLFAYYSDKNFLSIQCFFIRDGLLFGRHSDIVTTVDDPSEAVIEYIIKFYLKNNILPKEIIVPSDIDKSLLSDYLQVKVNSPTRGKIKQLLLMALDNAKIALNEKEEILNKNNEARLMALDELKELLHMDNVSRMEAFDNSHLFGTFYVGGMVVYEDFLPRKDEYRKYKISTGVKDDLGAMREVLYRRYYKVLMENLPKPDLIIMDGGENQVRVAKEIMDSLNLEIKILGLKKDEHHHTNILLDEDCNVLPCKTKSNLFVFLSKIQEDVHRYAITYHRNIKQKGSLASLLDVVPGIGEVRRHELLKKFGSLKKLREASLEELESVLSKEVAISLFNYLKEL